MRDAGPFAGLPLFASDHQLAVAIVGKERSKRWKVERLPTLSVKMGFPPIDAVHGGRPVPLVKRFYDEYLHLTRPVFSSPESTERPDLWNAKSRERSARAAANKARREELTERKRKALEEFRAKKAAANNVEGGAAD